jgi:hypothetical protein
VLTEHEHSTAANATLHSVNPRRALQRQEAAAPERGQRQRREERQSDPVIRQLYSLLHYYSLQYGHAQLFALCCLVSSPHPPADTPDDSPASTTVAANPIQSSHASIRAVQSCRAFRPPLWCGQALSRRLQSTLPSASTRFACNCQRPNGCSHCLSVSLVMRPLRPAPSIAAEACLTGLASP